MANKEKYTEENIQELIIHEHIRKRPSMYTGSTDMRGFINLQKSLYHLILSELKADTISFEIIGSHTAILRANTVSSPVIDNWSRWNPDTNAANPFILEFCVLNALSSHFSITLFNEKTDIVFEQEFEKGVFKQGDTYKKPIVCAELEIKYSLDKDIWQPTFKLIETYISHEIREFAYLHKNAKFKIAYQIDQEDCNITYSFKNGLQDRINIQKLNGYGDSYFDTYISERIEDFYIEIAFAFRSYTVDEPFLKSYVNDYYTHENGSHVDGLLKGLTNGVMKYFQKHHLTNAYKISEKGMKENLIAAVNIRMDAPIFSGCVRNKLANPEIIEPIASYIATILFDKIEKDEESTKKLIWKFEI